MKIDTTQTPGNAQVPRDQWVRKRRTQPL